MNKRVRRRILHWGIAGLALTFGAIQFVPVDRTNPPVTQDVRAPAEVSAILRRSCYDCHSNETIWPWYGKIAPVSWLVSHDVKEGREELNFSTWDAYTNQQQNKSIKEIWEKVDEGEMPLWFYVPLHPKAALSAEDRAALQAWGTTSPTASAQQRQRD